MTFNYNRSLSLADKLLANFGQTVTFKRIVNGSYDPDTSEQTVTESTYSAYGVLLDYKKLESGNSRDGMIEVNDKRLLVSAKGLTDVPNANDKVTIGTDTWNVINVKQIKPASIVVLYECQLRNG